MNAQDLNLIPKQYIQNGLMGHSKEIFFFMFASGDQAWGFATSPTQMKAFKEMFDKNIKEYEDKFGVIDTSKNLIPSTFPI